MKTTSTLALLFSALVLTPSITVANPTKIDILIQCPRTSGTENVLTRFEDYIGGEGSEILGSQGSRSIYFKSKQSLSQNFPTKLGEYQHDSVTYDSRTAEVTCRYLTYGPGSVPSFGVSYQLTNGQGGVVMNQARDSIMIRLPIGLQ